MNDYFKATYTMEKLREKMLNNWRLWVAILLAISTIFIYFVQHLGPIRSNDLWWHMALGRYYLETLSLVVDHSTLSWTPAKDFIYNHWISAIILYLAHQVGGLYGLAAFRYIVFGTLLFLAWHYSKKMEVATNPLVWMIVLVGLSISMTANNIKPGLFSFGLMTLTVWLFYHIRSSGERAWPLNYLFPMILVVWINVHGAFFIVSLFLILVVIGDFLNHRFSPAQAMPSKLRKHFLFSMFLCVPALFLNPYGHMLPLNIVKTVLFSDEQEPFMRLGEWTATSNFNVAPFYLLDYMILGIFIFLLVHIPKILGKKMDWVAILTVIAFCALYVKMVRVAAFLAPVLVFSVLSALDQSVWTKRSIKKDAVIALCCVGLTFFIGFRVIQNSYCGSPFGYSGILSRAFNIDNKPVDAADFIEQHLVGRKIGNDYDEGGYYLFRFWPGRLVSIDPRYVPYDDWIGEHFKAFVDQVNREEFFNKYKADFWVIDTTRGLDLVRWFLESPDWEPVFVGTTSVIFVPQGTASTELTISPNLENMSYHSLFINVFRVFIEIPNLEMAEKLTAIAKSNLDPACSITPLVLASFRNTIDGLTAFLKGDFVIAAELLAQVQLYPYKGQVQLYTEMRNMSSEIYTALAEDAFSDKRYGEAKEYAVKAYKLYSINSYSDLYNIAISDWAIRNFLGEKNPAQHDGFDWENVVEIILRNQEHITKHQEEIVSIVEEMKAGTYQGKGVFLSR